MIDDALVVFDNMAVAVDYSRAKICAHPTSSCESLKLIKIAGRI
jgi:hypothetical protein